MPLRNSPDNSIPYQIFPLSKDHTTTLSIAQTTVLGVSIYKTTLHFVISPFKIPSTFYFHCFLLQVYIKIIFSSVTVINALAGPATWILNPIEAIPPAAAKVIILKHKLDHDTPLN